MISSRGPIRHASPCFAGVKILKHRFQLFFIFKSAHQKVTIGIMARTTKSDNTNALPVVKGNAGITHDLMEGLTSTRFQSVLQDFNSLHFYLISLRIFLNLIWT
ncbi:hypothetical protein LH22_07555 [Pantoea rwandensis]|uniref:Uncharacterized protein n=1 Tax=Pantoea rwandensis TaxID=1076550 RepID=A0ABM5RHD4_9GAMM|nr:hypothetical protein LH22_07555 [Pantoea rwandensis]